MSIVGEWIETFQSVLKSPQTHFRTENRKNGFGFPLKFAIVSYLISGIFTASQALIMGNTWFNQMFSLSGFSMAVLVFVLSPITALIGLFIWSGLVNIFVNLLGGEGEYSDTLSVFEYGTAVAPLTLLSSLPFVGGLFAFLLAFYQLYIQIVGLIEYQGLSEWQAAGAIIIPGIIVIGLMLAIMAAFMALSASMMPTPTVP